MNIYIQFEITKIIRNTKVRNERYEDKKEHSPLI